MIAATAVTLSGGAVGLLVMLVAMLGAATQIPRNIFRSSDCQRASGVEVLRKRRCEYKYVMWLHAYLKLNVSLEILYWLRLWLRKLVANNTDATFSTCCLRIK